jgi:fumarylacetoacetase
MIDHLNTTHDPALRSWVASANTPDADFPIQNLPLGVFRVAGRAERPRLGVAIGDQVLDLAAAASAGLISGPAAPHCDAPALNGLLALGRPAWSGLRGQLSTLLRDGAPPRPELLHAQGAAELLLPAQVGDYSDAYASLFHATNVGSMFRPDNPLLPNYKYVPIAYHGRASSLIISGTALARPSGQRRPDESAPPSFGPCAALDYEAEIGLLIGPGNPLGAPVPIGAAGDQIFGLCLLNDWSARDIQRWEYQPLGPFLSKSFATSVSPWVVTLEALAPFRAPAFARPPGDPAPLPYLHDPGDQAAGGLAISVEVYLSSARMRELGIAPLRLSRGSFADMYWTPAQLVAHHASNGCNLRPGDMIASGTISGPTPDARGCLLELTWGGKEPIELPSGEQRRYLQDGDEVILRGYAERAGFRRIGLGECRGLVLPAAAAR